MSSLTEFLEARIADDEALAQAAHGARSVYGDYADGEVYYEDSAGAEDARAESQALWCAFTPVRVLAECAAKRAVLEFHKNWPVLVEEPPTFEQSAAEAHNFATGDLSSMTFRMSQRVAWLTQQQYIDKFGTEPPTSPILRAMAAPYSSHPDFDPAWGSDV